MSATETSRFYGNEYDGVYGDAARAVRAATYDVDFGQTGWMSAKELETLLEPLALDEASRFLEIACGSGGAAIRVAEQTGATVVGVDIHATAVESARERARRAGVDRETAFEVVDADGKLPFEDASFDVVFCNDAINHLRDRGAVLREWRRVLRPGGSVVFTDPIVMTGELSAEEIAVRSSIGYFLFVPICHNEILLAANGFDVESVADLTRSVAAVSSRWRDAREEQREPLTSEEGAEDFAKAQEFLEVVHQLAAERRLSRFAYRARKRG